MRYLITVEYCGRNYCGWQRQINAISVQEVLEEKLAVLLRHKVVLHASGRTDSKVHALGQAAHFDTETVIPPQKLLCAVNSMLPDDIRVRDCRVVPDDFHAQYSAKRKTYLYKAYVDRISSPVKEGLYARIIPPLDVELMQKTAEKLIGEHDFRAFSSTGSTVKTTVRTVYRLQITRRGNEIEFEIEGNGFLYNMVRIIVGTLIFVGKGKIPPENVDRMLQTGDRKAGGKTFAPEGLYLKSVFYPEIGLPEENCRKVDQIV